PVVGFCCPGVDHGQELQSIGLGQSHPTGPDLSVDPEWRVHGFQRDGVEYYQVTDLSGQVQFIIGTLDGIFWALPAGEPSSTLVLPPHHSLAAKRGARSIVYQGRFFRLVGYRSGDKIQWSVEESRAPR
ncbi:MAG: hypothetical protein ACRESP_21810, partial [Pseudomonas sp.]